MKWCHFRRTRYLKSKQEVKSLKEAFVDLLKVLQIVLTLSVFTTSCERLFSCLKTYLRLGLALDKID